jgi:HEAT repeat protein
MGIFRKKSEMDRLIDDLWNDNEEVRIRSVRNLGSMGEPAVEPIIEGVWRKAKKGVKMTSGPQDALAEIGELAIEPLVRTLKDIRIGSKNEIRSSLLASSVAAFALAKMSDKASESTIRALKHKAVKPLIETAKTLAIVKGDVNRLKFVAVCAALGNIGDRKAIEPLKSTIRFGWESDKEMQEKAREAIEKIDEKKSR